MSTPVPRECGRCTACCTAFAIAELDKLPGVPCSKLRKGRPGCGCYDTRPATCRTASCSWRDEGIGTEDHRPDKSNVVFAGHQAEGGRPYIIAYAMVPGAERRPWPMSIIKQARDNGHPVLVLQPGGGKAMLLPATGDFRPTSEILAEMKVEMTRAAPNADDIDMNRLPALL